MTSAGSYEPAPPAPRDGPAALANGRPTSPQRSYWPDKNPLPTPRTTLFGVAAALGLVALPWIVDLVSELPARSLWGMWAFGVAILIQVGMDTARPRPNDAVGVWTYRATYLLTPVLIVVLVMVVGDPFTTG